MKVWILTPNNYLHDIEEARAVAWFAKGLRHEVIRLAKKHRRLQEHELLILNEKLREDEAITEIVDTVVALADTFSQVEERLFLEKALSLLTPQQKKVITQIVLEGATEHEVASEMGVTHQAVHRMKERALNTLRKYFVLDKPHRQVEPYPGRTSTST